MTEQHDYKGLAAWAEGYAETERRMFGPDEPSVRYYNKTAAALRYAEEVIGKLPVTSDGVTIVPGMRVFPEMLADWEAPDGTIVKDEGGIVERYLGVAVRDTQGEKGPNIIELGEDEMAGLYSTREAALAARKETNRE
jgi:hypothetical protein